MGTKNCDLKSLGTTDINYTTRFFLDADMLLVMVFMSFTVCHFNKISSLRKNQHKTITITISKTGHRENNSRLCPYAGNQTNSAAKLVT